MSAITYMQVASVEIGPLSFVESAHLKERRICIRHRDGRNDIITLVGPTLDVRLEPDGRTVELYRRIEDLEREVGRLRAALGGEVGA